MPPIDGPPAEGEEAPVPAPAFHLLRRCLAASQPTEDLLELRLRLLSQVEAWEALYSAAGSLRLMPALAMRLGAKGLVPPIPKGTATPTAAPAEILAAHTTANAENRRQKRAVLLAILHRLNAEGITPVLLKGARDLILRANTWRTLRDIDLLVPPEQAEVAHAALLADGFATPEGEAERPNRHHLPMLFRDDLPGWVEIHRRAGNAYAEPFLPTAEILASAVPAEIDGATCLLMPPAMHVWHGLVHYQFGHSGFARGMIELKGLFEFAKGHGDLDASGRADLNKFAMRNAMGLAALDLWSAVAEQALGYDLHDLDPPTDALALARTVLSRSAGDMPAGSKYPGYGEMARLASNPARLERMGATGPIAKATARLRAWDRLRPKIRRSG